MKDLLKAIWKILKYVDNFFTFIRHGILNVILLICVIAVAVAVLNREDKEATALKIPENSVLQLNITGKIVEQEISSDTLSSLLSELNDADNANTCLQDILDVIHHAKNDKRIKAIFLDTSKMDGASLNQLTVIGEALKNFRSSGKKVLAGADSYSQGRYYLASWADTIMLNPMGSVDIFGLGRYSLYFKDAIDTLKMKYYIFKVGTYKSAIEPLIRNSMSDADREQSMQWLDSLWGDYSSHVVANRRLKPDALQLYTENMQLNLETLNGDSAKVARGAGLVDMLATRPQMRDEITRVAGEDMELIPLRQYLQEGGVPRSFAGQDGNIAIIIAEGTIIDGKAPTGQIGGDTIAQMLKDARLDDNIRAVVLRVNSGGGSAFASEVIREELLELKKSGKKIVVSMGSMAASGGYWISASADKIIASPTTITGSIGVFGVLPNFSDSLNAIGVHSDGVGTTPLSAGINVVQPLSKDIQAMIQLSVENTYNRFLNIVASGRNISMRRVTQIAEGRVYAGRKAQQLGLVDELGDMQRAIIVAGKLAKVQPKPILIRPKQTMKEKLMQFLRSARADVTAFMFGDQLGRVVSELEKQHSVAIDSALGKFNDPKGIYSWEPGIRPIR
ncbi:signal peptide peptidase SppA [Desulforhopalus vacuolatus]|uniref:signal peptide peptidase SppA n=1 Tax=Desulforhopalus vacuolatus TaxID=40414 RepID=UPI001962DFA0|nr:signal peptide peptidase SppA [Desulforhopalus vacuolatus]MBM9520712.1 signal peptide peptidase SppA [Desulforhopalus vacuolatus]